MLDGYIDTLDDGVLTGWAARSESPEPVSLEIAVDGAALGRVMASLYREDLKQAGIGDGHHAFEYRVPPLVRERGSYTITVRDTETRQELGQSPLIVNEGRENPLAGRRLRRLLAERYFSGEGLEIGPLHRPAPVPNGVRMTYADSYDHHTLKTLWSPEVDGHDIVPIDVVTDAATLVHFRDESFDFVILSHVLEHLENPIAGLRSALRVLRPAGVLFLALPDRRVTFDSRRPPTTIEHVLRDYCGGAVESRRGHYIEWVSLVEGLAGDDHGRRVAALESQRYAIHFHVWTPLEFMAALEAVSGLLPFGFQVEFFKANGPEGVWILQRT
jgi:SAM-dependent methyltransferase